jgi:ubiquinone/menaquinone biosynthesis C-methylase UbiE
LNYRIKLLLFFLAALAVLFLMDTGYSALNTLSRLDVVESQRDQWQRPADVISALQLEPGAEVVDLGCGSGYFTLKLSPQVGGKGHVIAEDIRWLPLAFLRVRAFSRRDWNVKITHGQVADPELPTGQVDAVLIVNTFHEFADPQSILMHVRNSLVPGGRLVIVDREPKPQNIGVTEMGDHEIALARVEDDLTSARFQIVEAQDAFIESDPDNETWWMVVARKL